MGNFILDRRLKGASRGAYGPAGQQLVRDVRDYALRSLDFKTITKILQRAHRPVDGSDIPRSPEEKAADVVERQRLELHPTADEMRPIGKNGGVLPMAIAAENNMIGLADYGEIHRVRGLKAREIDRQREADKVAGLLRPLISEMGELEPKVRANQALVEPFKDMTFDEFVTLAENNVETLKDLGQIPTFDR